MADVIFREFATTRYPFAASLFVTARPIPLEAPVTIATLDVPVGASGVVLLDEWNGVDMIVAPFVVEIFDICHWRSPSNLLVSSEPSIAGRHQISPLQTRASRLAPSANLAPHCEKAAQVRAWPLSSQAAPRPAARDRGVPQKAASSSDPRWASRLRSCCRQDHRNRRRRKRRG